MEIRLNVEPKLGTIIKIIGVGGAGGNAVNTMIRSNIRGVEYIAVNTDAQDLNKSLAETKIPLGTKLTRGLGAGAKPEIGRLAAEESIDDVADAIANADMLIISAGMGGGTGTGAAPVIAKKARELGILTLGVVSLPFDFEGNMRKENANIGIKNLREVVDTLIVIPNNKLPKIYGRLTAIDAFKKADDIITNAAEAISDIINDSATINVDFADVKMVMTDAGYGLMGGGIASGEDRVTQAVRNAIENPLLSDVDLSGCRGLLINVTAGSDLMMDEFEQVNEIITNETGKNGNIVSGLRIVDDMEGSLKITIIAAGLSANEAEIKDVKPQPQHQLVSEPQSVTEPIKTAAIPFPVPKPVEAEVMAEKEQILIQQERNNMLERIKHADPLAETQIHAKPFRATEFKQGEPPAFMKKYFN
jgi:cell division protein FtsZ